MTISEIENTLKDLQERHKDLNEAMLTTLLLSSGWEEKHIKEAVTLFKGREGTSLAISSNTSYISRPPVATVPLDAIPKNEPPHTQPTLSSYGGKSIPPQNTVQSFSPPPTVSISKDITKEVRPPTSSDQKDINTSPESLVVTNSTPIQKVAPSLPENLPLKPFDSTDHSMPLATYKEVYHKENEPLKEEKNVEEKHIHVTIKRTRLDGEDEGLIMLTGTMLLIILLLLAYMYTNGRL
jgi:hypothetical protein